MISAFVRRDRITNNKMYARVECVCEKQTMDMERLVKRNAREMYKTGNSNHDK